MDVNKQTQSAGDNSNQTIANTINNYYAVGVTEERVRVIMHEIYNERLSQLIEMARNIALDRVEKLSDMVIPKMLEYDQKLEFLADPSIQRAILTAQKSATCSNNEKEYALLSELLMERIKNRNDRKISFTHEKALEVIDRIPEDYLRLLSLISLLKYSYNTYQDWWHFHMVIHSFEMAVNKIMNGTNFPFDENWIETLETLSLIKSQPRGLNGLCRFEEILAQKYRNYFSAGTVKGGIQYAQAKARLRMLELPDEAVLIDHPFMSGRSIVDHPMVFKSDSEIEPMKFSDIQQQYFTYLEESINKIDTADKEVRKAFLTFWNTHELLKKLSEWWDRISVGFDLTSVGDLIGKTNLQINYLQTLPSDSIYSTQSNKSHKAQ